MILILNFDIELIYNVLRCASLCAKLISTCFCLIAGLVLQGCLSSSMMRPLEKKKRLKQSKASEGKNGAVTTAEEEKGLIPHGTPRGAAQVRQRYTDHACSFMLVHCYACQDT